MGPGLQKKKELGRKTRSQVLKAFNWKQDTADPVLLAASGIRLMNALKGTKIGGNIDGSQSSKEWSHGRKLP
jgi:hypothetical protein